MRTVWVEEQEKWCFSIVDVVAVLTEQTDLLKARKNWNKLKQRLVEERNQTVTNCHHLKMKAIDGKIRLTDVANQEQLSRERTTGTDYHLKRESKRLFVAFS